MNIKFLRVAFGLALSATVMSASAQKSYTQGVITYTITSPQGDIEAKTYFTPDSSATAFNAGPAAIKTIVNSAGTYVAVMVDVPVASIKKAGIGTPAEIEDYKSQDPKFVFTPTTETKQIAGFNCKKVTAKDAKGTSYDIWVTNDITVPTNAMTQYLKNAGGFPVQFVTIQMGNPVNITLKSIAEQKVAAGTFTVPKDFDKITLTDLKAMSGGGN